MTKAQQEFTQIYPKPGWVEHDPNEIWEKQVRVAKQAIEKNGLNWRSFQNNPEGAKRKISDDWMVRGWPTIVVLDAERKIRYRGHDGEAATAVARELLAKMQ